MTRCEGNSLHGAPGLRTRACSIAGGAGGARSLRCRGCSKTHRSLHMRTYIHTYVQYFIGENTIKNIHRQNNRCKVRARIFPDRGKVLPWPSIAWWATCVLTCTRATCVHSHACIDQLGTIKLQHSDHRLQDILLELSGHRRHILEEDNGRPLDPHVAHATAPADATSRVRSACPPNKLYACTCARKRRILCSADNTRPLIHACVRSLTHSFAHGSADSYTPTPKRSGT